MPASCLHLSHPNNSSLKGALKGSTCSRRPTEFRRKLGGEGEEMKRKDKANIGSVGSYWCAYRPLRPARHTSMMRHWDAAGIVSSLFALCSGTHREEVREEGKGAFVPAHKHVTHSPSRMNMHGCAHTYLLDTQKKQVLCLISVLPARATPTGTQTGDTCS